MEELIPKPLCRFCEEGNPSHVCYTCVDLENEHHDSNEGVLICKDCMSSIHCKGMFSSHLTSSLAAIDRTQSMILEIKDIKKFVCECTTEEILKLNVKRAMLRLRSEEASDAIHAKLMDVWNAFVAKLTDKEKDLNNQVDEQVRELCKQTDSLREKMKSIAAKATSDCDALLDKLSAKNRSLSDEELEGEKEQLNKLIAMKKEAEELVKSSFQDIGPYINIDLTKLQEDGLQWIDDIKLAGIQFHPADILKGDGLIVQGLSTPLSEGTEYVVPATFLSQAVLNSRHNTLSLPHPTVAENGNWVYHAMEYYLMQAVEQKTLKPIQELELHSYAHNSSVIAVKYREHAKMHRCYITFPHNDARSKARRWKETEVQIHHVDSWDCTPVKTMPVNKLYFYSLDSLAQSFSTLCVKVVAKVQDDNQEKADEWTPQVRKKLSKLIDSKEEMRVKLVKMLPGGHSDVILTWLADLIVGNLNLQSLFTADEDESEKAKLCQDVRVLRGDNIPVVRETIRPKDANDAADEEDTRAKEEPSADAKHSDQGQAHGAGGDAGGQGDAPGEVVCGVLVDLSDEAWDVATKPRASGMLKQGDADALLDAGDGVLGCQEAGKMLMPCVQGDEKGAVSNVPSVEERKEHIANVQRELKKILSTREGENSCQFLLDDNAEHNTAEMQDLVNALQPPLKPATDCNNNADVAVDGSGDPVASNDVTNVASALDLDPADPADNETNSDLDEYAPDCTDMRMDDVTPPGDAPEDEVLKCRFLGPDACQFAMPGPDAVALRGVLAPPPGLVGLTNAGAGPVAQVRHPAGTQSQPGQWETEERRSLRYVTLILFGEYSTEYLNAAIVGEPPAHIRKNWSGLIREQQWLWSLLPPTLYQQCFDFEVSRFPFLYQEFCRFRVPFNISQLMQRIGPQLPSYAQSFPDLKGALDRINNHFAKSQWRQVFAENDNIVVSVPSCGVSPRLEAGDVMETSPDKGDQNSPEQTESSERIRQSPASLPDLGSYSNRTTSNQPNSTLRDHVPVILKRSKSEGKMHEGSDTIKRTVVNDTKSASGHLEERECDWVEDEEEFPNPTPSAGVEPPTSGSQPQARGERRESRGDLCFNCGAFGHKKANCPHPMRRDKNNSNYGRRNSRYPRNRRSEQQEDRRRGRR